MYDGNWFLLYLNFFNKSEHFNDLFMQMLIVEIANINLKEIKSDYN